MRKPPSAAPNKSTGESSANILKTQTRLRDGATAGRGGLAAFALFGRDFKLRSLRIRCHHGRALINCGSFNPLLPPNRFRSILIPEYNMQTTIEESPVVQKARELCQIILEQPNMSEIRQRIDAFLGDEKSRAQYDNLMAKGQSLQQKQQSSTPLSGDEIASFEQDREALLQNPVARGFLDAQEEIHTMQESIHQLVDKTLELGRMPTDEDLNGGSCGHGCGCHH